MSEDEVAAWRTAARKKRKASKMKENRRLKKEILAQAELILKDTEDDEAVADGKSEGIDIKEDGDSFGISLEDEDPPRKYVLPSDENKATKSEWTSSTAETVYTGWSDTPIMVANQHDFKPEEVRSDAIGIDQAAVNEFSSGTSSDSGTSDNDWQIEFGDFVITPVDEDNLKDDFSAIGEDA